MQVTADFTGAATPLDLILGPPDAATAIAVGEQEPGKDQVWAHWFANTRQGRADAYALADKLSANGRNTFLSPCLWDAEVLDRKTPTLCKKPTPHTPVPPKFAQARGLWLDQDQSPSDPSLWNQLIRGGAVLTRTRGQHLRIPLAAAITDPAVVERWNKHLAARLGADTSKCHIASWLTFPGSTRFKAEYPEGLPVRVVRVSGGRSRSTQALEALAGIPQAGEASTDAYAGDIESVSVELNAARYVRLRRALRTDRAKGDGDETDRFRRLYGLVKECVKAGLSIGQTLYVLAEHPPAVAKFPGARLPNWLRGQYPKAVAEVAEETPDASHTEGSKESNMATDPTTSDDTGLGVLDLMALRKNPPPPPVFLEAGLFQEGVGTKVTAASGSGKTILLADLAWHWSLGRCALTDEKLVRPRKILYVDGEVGQPWWIEYLGKFDAPLETPNLNVIAFPEWAPLDTDAGARSFWEAVETVAPDAVFLDTLSAFIEGEENDASTYAAFDRRITLPLIRRGITFISSDHTGKDASRGSRGSSAKMSKLWAEWQMSADPNDPNELVLKCTKDRSGVHRMGVELPLTRADSPLRHSLDPALATLTSGVRGEARPGAPRITDATLERRLVGTLAAFPNASRNKILNETQGERARLLPILERLLDGSETGS